MTTHVTIPNGDIDQDSPVTQPLLTSLRDNLYAVIEGDVTAPRIFGAAMYSTFAGTTVQRNCLPFGSEVLNVSGGGGTVALSLPVSAFTALVDCQIQVRISCTISAGAGA